MILEEGPQRDIFSPEEVPCESCLRIITGALSLAMGFMDSL